MYLKSIILRGFKSFANKTQLFFEPGISVIVGPNGSGKSNLADAISWVLGEQSPKSLRGSSMGDVIFRSKNEELAIAEVSLIFDNCDRLIPLEFSEVKITRRTYLKGGSEYYVNSSPCKLNDIQDIISETGIGRGLYVIVSQGQINQTILLKPLERKEVIEEVLGISRHKLKRNKAISRLVVVNEDINRIEDLIREVKRTMNPLEIEAQRAKKYFEIYNTLKNEEISFFLGQLAYLNSRWDEEERNSKRLKIELGEISEKINKMEKKKQELIEELQRTRSEFETWDKIVRGFDHKEMELENLVSLVESRKSMFGTLRNMWDLKLIEQNQKQNQESSNSYFKMGQGEALETSKTKGDYLEFLEGLVRDINGIKEILDSMLKKIQAIDDMKLKSEIENCGALLKKELESLWVKADKALKASKILYRSSERLSDFEVLSPAGSEEAIRGLKSSGSVMGFANELKSFCEENYLKAENLISFLKVLVSAGEKIKKEIYSRFNQKDSVFREFSGSLTKINDLVNRLNLDKSRIENKIEQIELKKEQIKEKVKDMSSRIVDTYELPLDYIFKNYRASQDLERSDARIKELKNKLKEIGSVNPNAVLEYEKIKQRFDFLTSQKEDLVESKKHLESLIDDINKRIEEIFMEKFEEINANFENYFKTLFPLGEAELVLVKNNGNEYDDIGIDLKVDIGNSKFIPLSLLSGGEKSLISIAFLFSVFSVKSSPFYVFDEIDAFLDDVNLDRFLTLIRKFSMGRQVILITHQKKTMEIADAIYGVSMQSNGVSKIISEKINKNYAKIN
ncbi:MAG: AAA family ATPase [Actinobacteria bacterium]|nr:AAA family ATPase [Actinomycetota bacterium]